MSRKYKTSDERFYFTLTRGTDIRFDEESKKWVPNPDVECRPFGTHGKVGSLYNALYKAKQYAGKSGKILSFHIDEIAEHHDDPQLKFEEAERLMMYWAERADEYKRKLLEG